MRARIGYSVVGGQDRDGVSEGIEKVASLRADKFKIFGEYPSTLQHLAGVILCYSLFP